MVASTSFTFRAKADLSDAIRQSAVAQQRPVSDLIRDAIRQRLITGAAKTDQSTAKRGEESTDVLPR